MALIRNSARYVAFRLLKYIGVTALTTAGNDPDNLQPGLVAGDLDDVAACLTAALQEMFKEGPAAISERRISVLLHEPTAIVMDVAHNGGGTIVSGYESWMLGCPISVAGDPYFNVLDGTGPGDVLERPYVGTTATGVQATVYGSSILLPSNIRNVIEPVELTGRRILRAAPDGTTFHQHGGSQIMPPVNQGAVGQPEIWFAEAQYDESQEYLPIFLRVSPMPNKTEPISFRAKMNPQRINVEDLGNTDDDDDPGVMFAIPGNWVEEILIPIALQRWTAHPAFKNNDAKTEIGRQYKQAIATLKDFRPQISQQAAAYFGEIRPDGHCSSRT